MECMTLMGADDVRSAGNRMASAAETMRSAASQFDSSVDRLIRALEDHAQRIETALGEKSEH